MPGRRVAVMFVCYLFIGCDCVEITQFLASSTVCHNAHNDSPECSQSVFSGGDKTMALIRCRDDDSCVGISEDTSDQDYFFLHYACERETVCGENDVPVRYYSKHCAHGGKWTPSENKCHCVDGWVGTTCQDLPRDYRGLLESGYPPGAYRTYYDLQAEGLGLVPVYPYITGLNKYTHVKIMEHTGNINFNLSWTKFRKGFFNDDFNMWAGLDAWFALSQVGYNKFLAVLNFKTTGNLYRIYSGFSLSDAFDGFRISFIGSTRSGSGSIARKASFEECFGPHVGLPFSTFDRDVDGNANENCAATVGSGWWYGGYCFNSCNMFGWGPNHWGSIPDNQRVSVLGVPEHFITSEEWFSIKLLLRQ